MSHTVDSDRLESALSKTRARLLAQHCDTGAWNCADVEGSPLATAAAICALVAAERHVDDDASGSGPGGSRWLPGVLLRAEFNELIIQGLKWLADRQNDDGGWGDCHDCKSTLAATMLVDAAFHVTGVPAKFVGILERTESFIRTNGGIKRLVHDYRDDTALASAVLAARAAADLIPWRRVPSMRFEPSWTPAQWRHPSASKKFGYQTPLRIAIGLTRHGAAPSRFPPIRWLNSAYRRHSLSVLAETQSSDGGFFASIPTTGFVVLCLARAGLADDPVARSGVEYLLSTVQGGGVWPLTPNMDVRGTSYAVGALADDFDAETSSDSASDSLASGSLWIAQRQSAAPENRSGESRGGWQWSSTGGICSVEDTSAAVQALVGGAQRRSDFGKDKAGEILRAASEGVGWLLDRQNGSGGWACMLCSSANSATNADAVETTAEAIVALSKVRTILRKLPHNQANGRRIEAAIDRGCRFLESAQTSCGSWLPAMYGNQHVPGESNAVYGTARALSAIAAAGSARFEGVQRGVDWLVSVQHASGGWGPASWPGRPARSWARPTPAATQRLCSIEETAVAVEALIPFIGQSDKTQHAAALGLSWLSDSLLADDTMEPATICRFLGRIWRRQPLWPDVLAMRALRSGRDSALVSRLPLTAAR